MFMCVINAANILHIYKRTKFFYMFYNIKFKKMNVVVRFETRYVSEFW